MKKIFLLRATLSALIFTPSLYAGKQTQLDTPPSLHVHNHYDLLAEDHQNDPLLPIVLIHGLTATGNSMQDTKALLQELAPGTEIYTPDLPGYAFDNCDYQVAYLATYINEKPALKNGFNIVGHSMGGVIARGVIESGLLTARAYSLVTLASPHRGICGIPTGCHSHLKKLTATHLNNILTNLGPREEFYRIAYRECMQHHSSIANIWHEPRYPKLYCDKNLFLPLYNIEKFSEKSMAFRSNLATVLAFTALAAQNDGVVKPLQSACWDYYDENHTHIKPLEQSPIYDNLGLCDLILDNKFKRFMVPETNHSTIRTDKEVLRTYVLPSLMRESHREDDVGNTIYEDTRVSQ